MANTDIYFNIVPKGNEDFSLYLEDDDSTLTISDNKNSKNAQWTVKWLGVNEEQGMDMVVLINRGLHKAIFPNGNMQGSYIVPTSALSKDDYWLFGDIKETKFRGIFTSNNTDLTLNIWGGQYHIGKDVRLYPFTSRHNDLWSFQLVEQLFNF
ncbi:hypothetical protein F8M41_017697 [Gigaspora margarita]|uniref:Uncharacterized protein n=1 Tax=Gigaspora margarita TaxID=4874 RepID=A0A8H4AMP1_GIGMA|nr:hypothetical protein F8M41_017697 [Gigaspora margarita]